MPAKRALKLDSVMMGKVTATPQMSGKKNHLSFSPTTGTCLMSPFSSPRSSNIQEQRNGLSKGKRDAPKGLTIKSSGKEQPQIEESDKLIILQSEVENSLESFLKIRQNLTSLQALEGSRELENIIGVVNNSGDLRSEVKKTRKLLEEASKQKLLKRSHVRHPAQGFLRRSICCFCTRYTLFCKRCCFKTNLDAKIITMNTSMFSTAMNSSKPLFTKGLSEEYVLLGCKIQQLRYPTEKVENKCL